MPDISMAWWKKAGGSGILVVPIIPFPRLVQTNPASNVAGMLMNRQTGLCRWLSREWARLRPELSGF